jgi:superfamily II DNA or RNA helicase
MSRTVRLRAWQKRALDQFLAAGDPDFLAVATPGAGKTTFALTAARHDLAGSPRRPVVVVAPTQHLKVQWAQAAARFGLHLLPRWSVREGRLPADMHGLVVTYQQVAANPQALAEVARGAFVVLDEIHHAGEERAWGDGLRWAFGASSRRLAISGTPFRSDTNAIPFVRYDHDLAVADFTYTYGDALRDGSVVRPVYFPRIDGEMEWTAADGVHHRHTFGDRLDAARAGQRLRTALALHGEWLPAVLRQAHERLLGVRRAQPDAGGLVIAADQEHARGIAAILRDRLGVPPVLAISEDPEASARIAAFAGSTQPWIVAVRMVSEGVDIPRLRVGVFATTTTTELFFRQAVGRLVRHQRGLGSQRAYLYIPDDERLRTAAVNVAEERRHSLRRRDDAEVEPDAGADATARGQADEQLSLFAAISAVALDGDRDTDHDGEAEHARDAEDPGHDVALPPLPSHPGATPADADELFGFTASPAEPDAPTRTRHQHKRDLRASNADRARTLATVTGLGHARVNTELNRLAGVRTISEATVEQLQTRLGHADRWLERLARR